MWLAFAERVHRRTWVQWKTAAVPCSPSSVLPPASTPMTPASWSSSPNLERTSLEFRSWQQGGRVEVVSEEDLGGEHRPTERGAENGSGNGPDPSGYRHSGVGRFKIEARASKEPKPALIRPVGLLNLRW